MIKSSSLNFRVLANRRRCKGGNRVSSEWTYEGDRKSLRTLVAVDGNAPVKMRLIYMYKAEWMIFHQLGWHRRIFKSCPFLGIRLFLRSEFYDNFKRTMATLDV